MHSKNDFTYKAVYAPKTDTYISDYVPQPGDMFFVTVKDKETGEVLNEYTQAFDKTNALMLMKKPTEFLY